MSINILPFCCDTGFEEIYQFDVFLFSQFKHEIFSSSSFFNFLIHLLQFLVHY